MMKKKASNIILSIVVGGIMLYLLYTYIQQKQTDDEIIQNGIYTIAYINKEYISKQSVREYNFIYIYNDDSIFQRRFVEVSYFNKHQIGDTIIIKFLPDAPEKSMIIEDKEYKSCYGVPPASGWKELPQCE